MKYLIYLLIGFILMPLPVMAEDRATFTELFERYNEAKKIADTNAVTSYLAKTQRSVLIECLSVPSCGMPYKKSMKKYALTHYKITAFETMQKGRAYQLFYQGTQTDKTKGKGSATFVQENGVWKISMTMWKPEN